MHNPTQQDQVRRYLWRVVEVSALLVFIVVVITLFIVTFKYTMPFVVGWIVAMLLSPVIRSFEKHGVKRLPAVLTVLASLLVILLGFSTFIVIAIAREATMLTTNTGKYFALVNAWLTHQIAVGKVFYGKLPPQVAANMEGTLAKVVTSVEQMFQGLASFLIDTITHLPEYMFVGVISCIAAFFFLVNRERMMSRLFRALPPGWSGKLEVTIADMMRAFIGSIRVQLILMVVSAVLGIFGMWLLAFPYAVILGLLIGIFGIVPVVGSAIITVPWAFGALVVGDAQTALKLIALQISISVIRHLIEPKILADSVGLDTLSTLFALYVGSKVLGVLGLFLGPIILIGIKSLIRTHLFVDFLPIQKVESNDKEESVESEARVKQEL